MNLLPKRLRSDERVPVFDPEVSKLSLVALSQLNSSSILQQTNRFTEALQKILTCIAAQYIALKIPKFRSRFDIYCSNEAGGKKTYALVTSLDHANAEVKQISHLDFSQLG